ncbi:MAG: heme biosynthesis HemY N-terminal domain-containing protein [Chromatiales bacterium]
MKAGLLIIVTLALGALAANYMLADNGYVLINFRGYAIEMSVPVLAFLLLFSYLGVRLIVRIWEAPRKLGEMAARRRMHKANELIVRGYIEMGEGNLARGERLLTKGVRNSETPLLNYLAAARAAQAQGDRGRRDNWLKMAYEQDPRATATVLLTQAELQFSNEEYESARATLNQVLELTPGNSEALRLKAELCLKQGDWQDLRGLLPKLRKVGHVPAAVLDSWYERTWPELLDSAGDDAAKLQELWDALPRHLRNKPPLIAARVRALVRQGQPQEGETILRKTLNSEWSEQLVRLYGTIDGVDVKAALKNAEKWLQQRPNDAALLLTAGRLCVRKQLWGKARSYFESSLGLQPSPEVWHELGKLLNRMGEEQAAFDAYQKGLTLSYGGTDVPRISRSGSRRGNR